MNDCKEVVIVGSGLAGLTMAYALSKQNIEVSLCSPTLYSEDPRTTALLWDSVEYLKTLGLWEKLEPKGHPLKVMRIVDGTKRLVRSTQADFHASELQLDAFGYNFKNVDIISLLLAELEHSENFVHLSGNFKKIRPCNKNCKYKITIEDESHQEIEIKTEFIIGADGKNSIVRNQLFPEVTEWSYPQSAFVVDFGHQIGSSFTSTEIHTENGPFTVVPQSANRAGLVWMHSPEHVAHLLNLGKVKLEETIEEKMHSYLGRIELLGDPAAFPMKSLIAHKFGASGCALIGDAAHSSPPIGAQGFNLGIRDIKALAKLFQTHQDSDRLGAMYNEQRRIDVESRTKAVDILNRSLLVDILPGQMAKVAGLQLLLNCQPLRKTVMKLGISQYKF